MSELHESVPRRPLRVSTLLTTLPQGVELERFRDFLVSHSHPDPERRWASSGELGTVGDRLVDLSTLTGELSRLARAEAERVERLHTLTARAIEALQRGDPEKAVTLFLTQGEVEEAEGRTMEAERWFLSAYRMARDAALPQAPGAIRKAARTARTLGHLDTSSERYEVAWNEAMAIGAEHDKIVAATGRGNVAVDQGRWEEALEWYQRGLALLSEGTSPRRERWQLLQNLAIVHRRSGRLQEARQLLEEAEREGMQLDDPDSVVEIGNGWGQLLLAEGDVRGAELFFSRALIHASTARARATIRVNLGEALLLQGRSLEAGEQAREAEADAIAGGVIAKLPEIYRLLASVAQARGEVDAFVFLEQTLTLIRERGLPLFEEALTLEVLADFHRSTGEEARSREERERAAEIYDKIGLKMASARLRNTREDS